MKPPSLRQLKKARHEARLAARDVRENHASRSLRDGLFGRIIETLHIFTPGTPTVLVDQTDSTPKLSDPERVLLREITLNMRFNDPEAIEKLLIN